MKPWQPFRIISEKGANSSPSNIGRDKSDICFKIFHHIQSSSDLSGELFGFNYPVSFFDECLQFHFATSINIYVA